MVTTAMLEAGFFFGGASFRVNIAGGTDWGNVNGDGGGWTAGSLEKLQKHIKKNCITLYKRCLLSGVVTVW